MIRSYFVACIAQALAYPSKGFLRWGAELGNCVLIDTGSSRLLAVVVSFFLGRDKGRLAHFIFGTIFGSNGLVRQKGENNYIIITIREKRLFVLNLLIGSKLRIFVFQYCYFVNLERSMYKDNEIKSVVKSRKKPTFAQKLFHYFILKAV